MWYDLVLSVPVFGLDISCVRTCQTYLVVSVAVTSNRQLWAGQCEYLSLSLLILAVDMPSCIE